VGPLTTAEEFDVRAARKVIGPPRLIRETPEPIAECPGCGARMALGAEGTTWTVHSPRDVADRLILQLGGLEREELIVLLLNTKNVVVGQTTVYRGNVSASLVRVGELFHGGRQAGRGASPDRAQPSERRPDPERRRPQPHGNGDRRRQTPRCRGPRSRDHRGGSYISLRDRGSAFDTSVPGRHASSAESR